MEPEVQPRRSQKKKGKLAVILLAGFIGLTVVAATVFTYMTLSFDRIYKGITVGSLDASGMTRDELKKTLDIKYQSVADQQEIQLKAGKAEVKASFPELGVRFDTDKAAGNANAIGRSGTIFNRLYDVANAGISGVSLDLPKTYDSAKVDAFITDFYQKTLAPVREGSLLVTDTTAVLRSGSHGENIDREKALNLVRDMIQKGSGGTLDLEIITTQPAKFNTEELYQQIYSEPVDATYKVENNNMTLQPHKVGRKIDKAQLESIAAELEKTENTQRTLPVTFAAPAVTSEMATAMLFKDELASWHTSFSTGTVNGKNRGYNMGLAVSKINGMILAPGQEFSYNNIVGPRDVTHGFKLAHVYSAGKIIDGAGGGICQVSSTMYAAILRADIEVVERRNHSFTVGYVPLGQDATAYYGGTDFRFRNSTKWPIRLLASIKGNKVYCSIMGTNDNPGKEVTISYKTLSKTPYTIKYIDDPSLPAGVTKEKLPGMNGYVVETYKTVKQDGKVVSQTKLHTSTYKVYAQEMLRGTKGGVAGTSTGTAIQPKPAVQPKPANQGATGNTGVTVENPSGVESNAEDIIDEASPDVTNGSVEPGSQTGTEAVPAP